MEMPGSERADQLVVVNEHPSFIDPTSRLRYQPFGVVKIENIPYASTIQEIKQFTSRLTNKNSLIQAHVHGFPVHVIMDRPTGKTQDCYVEFMNPSDATTLVWRTESAYFQEKPLKIGQRHVNIQLSCQGELMSKLFPRAKNVKWDSLTGEPHILEVDDGDFQEGFRGFFTIEEMVGVVKHAETPQRSPFSSRCMQRTYESMISTLYKFPWRNTMHYTIAARDYMFTSYMAQLQVLLPKATGVGFAVDSFVELKSWHGEREVGLSHALLMDFLFAGLNVAAFSQRQKWLISAKCGQAGARVPLSSHAMHWPFQCLGPAEASTDESLEVWLSVLDMGYRAMVNNKENYEFSEYIQIVRDDHGYVTFNFTNAATSMKYAQGVYMEEQIMRQILSSGWKKLCADHDISYSVDEVSQAGPSISDSSLESMLASLNLSSDDLTLSDSREGVATVILRNNQDANDHANGARAAQSGVPSDQATIRSAQPTVPTAPMAMRTVHLADKPVLNPQTPDFMPSGPATNDTGRMISQQAHRTALNSYPPAHFGGRSDYPHPVSVPPSQDAKPFSQSQQLNFGSLTKYKAGPEARLSWRQGDKNEHHHSLQYNPMQNLTAVPSAKTTADVGHGEAGGYADHK